MTKCISLFILLFLCSFVSAQQHYTKELLQGTWHLTTINTDLVGNFQERNKCTKDFAKDSMIILVFNSDSMLKITSLRYQAPDTILYVWEIKDNFVHFWLPKEKRKKQIRKYLSIASLTNFRLIVRQSLHDHSSVINSYVNLHMTFTKETNEESNMLQKLYYGDWFITDKRIRSTEDLLKSTLIKLQRTTYYLDTTASLNPCKKTTKQYLNSRLLSISDFGEATIYYKSDTIFMTPPPCNRPSYESSIYLGGSSIDNSTVITVFNKSQQIRLTSRYVTPSFYKFDRLGNTLILTKLYH